MLGFIIALVIVIAAAKKGFLVLKNEWSFADESEWEPGWCSCEGETTNDVNNDSIPVKKMSTALAWTPYLIIVSILVLTRISQVGLMPFFKDTKFQYQIF